MFWNKENPRFYWKTWSFNLPLVKPDQNPEIYVFDTRVFSKTALKKQPKTIVGWNFHDCCCWLWGYYKNSFSL